MENCPHINRPEEVDRLERSLRDAEDRLMRRYCDLGKSMLETVEAKSTQINGLVDEVIALRRRLSTARGEIVCPSCLNRNPADIRFCSRCGAPLPADSKGATPQQKKG